MSLVLASGSATRAEVLRNAGVPFEVDAADVDEAAIKKICSDAGRSVDETALELAHAKARLVSERQPGKLVLGADQMLECDGVWLSKAGDEAGAKEQLAFLSGKTHLLVTAAVLLRDGHEVWRGAESAEMTMRALSPEFIDDYCQSLGDDMLKSVGCYKIEGLGVQLFSKLTGNHFVVLGLPLLPLLGVLRNEKVIPA